MFTNIFKTKTKVFAVAWAMWFFCFTFPSVNAQTKEIVIKAGTPIEATTLYEISSKTHPVGTTVELKLLNQVSVKGQVVIPAGSTIKGRVTQSKKHSIFGQSGSIAIEATSVTGVDGTLVPVTGLTLRNEGKGRLGWALVTGFTCLPLFGFLIPGQQGIIPAGSQLSGNVMANTTITIDAEE